MSFKNCGCINKPEPANEIPDSKKLFQKKDDKFFKPVILLTLPSWFLIPSYSLVSSKNFQIPAASKPPKTGAIIKSHN